MYLLSGNLTLLSFRKGIEVRDIEEGSVASTKSVEKVAGSRREAAGGSSEVEAAKRA